MKFDYQARTKDGQIQKGLIEASSEEAALAILQKYGLYVTTLKDIKPEPLYARKIGFLQRISSKDIVVFSRQLSILFKSQVPIVESLTVLAKQTEKQEFKEKIIKISEEVEGGTTLSNALSLYPKIFNSFMINMLKSGEASGKLSETLNYLADHLEHEYNSRNKILGAMIYPIFVLVVFIVVLLLMVFVIMPPITEILVDSGQELPFITKVVMAFSSFMVKWFLLIALFIVGGILLIARYLRTPQGKAFFDEKILKIPLMKNLLKKVFLTRFAENLSTLISGGLPIARALEISSNVIGNDVYKKIITKIKNEVRKGETISSVLEEYPREFPPLFIQMFSVGEKSGRIEGSLANIVLFYRKETNKMIDDFLGLLEPLMIVVLALFVTGLLASVLLPIYQAGSF
ncbi:type II secretion system F family protein [Patescibacteria group bacterium]